jgi:hypothetical protein
MRINNAGGRIEHVPEILYHWRQHEVSSTNNSSGNFHSINSVRFVLERQLQINPKNHNFSIKNWPVNRGAEELYIERKHINMPIFFHYGEVENHMEIESISNGILIVTSPEVFFDSNELLTEVARLFDLHPQLGGVGGNIFDVNGNVYDSCSALNKRGELESYWADNSPNNPGPYALGLKTQCVDFTSSCMAFFRISALQKLSQWPLNIEDKDLITFTLCSLLRNSNWLIAYSPLVFGRTNFVANPRKEYYPKISDPNKEKNSLVRYGATRNFKG